MVAGPGRRLGMPSDLVALEAVQSNLSGVRQQIAFRELNREAQVEGMSRRAMLIEVRRRLPCLVREQRCGLLPGERCAGSLIAERHAGRLRLTGRPVCSLLLL